MVSIVKITAVILLLALFSIQANAEPVNINTATAKEIATAIKGVGIKKANAIVDYREKNGPFQTVDEMTNVSGIGIKTVQQNIDALTVDASVSTTATNPQKTSKADKNTSTSKTF